MLGGIGEDTEEGYYGFVNEDLFIFLLFYSFILVIIWGGWRGGLVEWVRSLIDRTCGCMESVS